MIVCRIMLQNILSTYKKSNYNDDISNVYDLPFDEMCLFLEWMKSMTQRQKNRQSVCYSKQYDKNMVQMFWHWVRVR